MHALSILALGLAPLLASASTIPRDNNDTYSFTIFQSTNCSNSQGNMTIQGTPDNFPTCATPLEFYFGSVIVNADVNHACSITFFNQTIEDDQCRGPVSSEPGSMQIGQCFQFEPNNHPITYGVVCG